MAKGGRKANPRGGRVSGTVKSYNGEKGYGFIVASSVTGDLMFMRSDLPADLKEVRGKFLDQREVTFDVSMVDGKNKATNLEVLAKDGEMFAGKIKSYSEKNNYGFIESSMSPGEDIKFNTSDLDGLLHPGVTLTDELVIFMPVRKADGKMSVSKMMFQSSKIASRLKVGGASPVKGGSVARQAPLAPLALPGGLTVDSLSKLVTLLGGHLPASVTGKRVAGAAELSHQSSAKKPKQQIMTTHATGQYVSGTVKSFNASKKFGFITCDDVPGDVFFMASDLPDGIGQISPGTSVSFDLMRTSDGKLRGNNLAL